MPDNMLRLQTITTENLHTVLRTLKPSLHTTDTALQHTVGEILAQVQTRGDAALLEYTNRFDRTGFAQAAALRISADAIANAATTPELEAALMLAAERIRAFHAPLRPPNHEMQDAHGARLGVRWTAVRAAGLYVPGGTATYPSTVLMNAIPAQVAGVERLVMVVPTPDGILNPLLLVAARIAGIKEIYAIGGAQAIAALTYGTETIAPVDVIVGPGNRYVAEAKRQVHGLVGTDGVAGPSDILVVADHTANPAWVAADLLSQAEHDPFASAMLLTDDAALAEAVRQEVTAQLATLPRQALAEQAMQNRGAILLVEDAALFPQVVDAIAPEHLELAVAQPHALFERIRNAGAAFLGHWSSEILGDYVAGPSHVLPTEGTARFASGLSVWDFLKRTTYMHFDAASFAPLADAAERLAIAEGLEGHARSIRVRRNQRLEDAA